MKEIMYKHIKAACESWIAITPNQPPAFDNLMPEAQAKIFARMQRALKAYEKSKGENNEN